MLREVQMAARHFLEIMRVTWFVVLWTRVRRPSLSSNFETEVKRVRRLHPVHKNSPAALLSGLWNFVRFHNKRQRALFNKIMLLEPRGIVYF
jgi:hypothetical protein